MRRHLVFYDGVCGLCDLAVQFILKRDKKQQFIFAPLQGKTAAKVLKDLPSSIRNEDSIILIENYGAADAKTVILGKAALRILWILGGAWSLIGSISFLPAWLYDWKYRLIARHRHRFFSKDRCVVPSEQNSHRFLD
jgi:predicted DCC family thiol-disulfide oxidoreductase YuxK